MKGLIISGEYGKVLARVKSGETLEIGELVVAERSNILLQVTDLLYGSQVSLQNLELISGLGLEENAPIDFYDPDLRNYTLAKLKTLISLNHSRLSKELPAFLSPIREVRKEDLAFMGRPKNPLFIGKLRSGSRELDVDVCLPAEEVLSHHILIPATTGRGKSNLTSCLLWNTLDKDFCAAMVLDPHDEYYGRNTIGLKDHPQHEKVSYYTANKAPPGANSLRINLSLLRPSHFDCVGWSDAQRQALYAFYKEYGEKWIESIIMEKNVKEGNVSAFFKEATIAVVKRRLLSLLDLEWNGKQLTVSGVFVLQGGESTIESICNDLEKAKVVIVDTSSFSGEVELLIGSLISAEVLRRYRFYLLNGKLADKPVINIVLEEAPRVLGKDILEKGTNIFETIAREGRKFKVGLTAITQLPSLIPRQILANMNTKIILGIEMAPERQAIIDSASQDLSEDSRTIASLDIGEAIVSSTFAKFAVPVRIPKFEELVKASQKRELKMGFSGLKQ